MSQQTVTINGTVYDTQTGMPLEQTGATPVTPEHQTEKAQAKPNHSHVIHQKPQRSQTLNRRVAKGKAQVTDIKGDVRPMVKKSPLVTKFAPHPAGITQKAVEPVTPHVPHPAVVKAQAQANHKAQQQVAAAPKPARVIKQEAIANALNNAPDHAKQSHHHKPKAKKLNRLFSVGSAGLALLVLGAYFTYLNMPNLSVRVAAAQAGVDASYPGYKPDGYSLSGAVAYTQGEVNMKFASNGGPQNFTLTQKKSSWDSSAVLDHHVKDKAGENYITYSEQGLTIYTYGSNAAWVNNGILYTIDGDAPLSSDQIRHIATSM